MRVNAVDKQIDWSNEQLTDVTSSDFRRLLKEEKETPLDSDYKKIADQLRLNSDNKLVVRDKNNNERHRIVVPKHLRTKMLHHLHDFARPGRHLGTAKTIIKVRSSYFYAYYKTANIV